MDLDHRHSLQYLDNLHKMTKQIIKYYTKAGKYKNQMTTDPADSYANFMTCLLLATKLEDGLVSISREFYFKIYRVRLGENTITDDCIKILSTYNFNTSNKVKLKDSINRIKVMAIWKNSFKKDLQHMFMIHHYIKYYQLEDTSTNYYLTKLHPATKIKQITGEELDDIVEIDTEIW